MGFQEIELNPQWVMTGSREKGIPGNGLAVCTNVQVSRDQTLINRSERLGMTC